ncbi:MAG TPA: hypothetical protein P5561_04665 [Candidatus Omnitrophota bacterium]|nr:hypothetical protein [Candidatus Omnitrophota bacterium]
MSTKKVAILETKAQADFFCAQRQAQEFSRVAIFFPKRFIRAASAWPLAYEDGYTDNRHLYRQQMVLCRYVQDLCRDLVGIHPDLIVNGINLLNCFFRDLFYFVYALYRNEKFFHAFLEKERFERAVILKEKFQTAENNPLNQHFEEFCHRERIPTDILELPLKKKNPDKNADSDLLKKILNFLTRLRYRTGPQTLLAMKDSLFFLLADTMRGQALAAFPSKVNYRRFFEYFSRDIQIHHLIKTAIPEQKPLLPFELPEPRIDNVVIPLRSELFRRFISEKAALVRSILPSLSDFLIRSKPEKIILDEDMTVIARTLALLARKNRIPTTVVQHGSLIREDAAPGFFPLEADKLVVMDKMIHRELCDIIPSERMEINDYGYFNNLTTYAGPARSTALLKQHGLESQKYILVINPNNKWTGMRGIPIRHMTPAVYERFLEGLLSLVQRFPKMIFALKLRPGDLAPEKYAYLDADFQKLPNFHLVAGNQEAAWGLLATASCVISPVWSTAVVEAIKLNRPVFFWDLQEAYEKLDSLLLDPNFHRVKTKEELESALLKLSANEIFR